MSKSKMIKATILLNEEQQEKFKSYVKNEFDLTNNITDEEIPLYLKAIILKCIGEVDFIKELEEIELRIERDKKDGEKFILNELFTKEEWEKKKFFKMILGRMFYAKCKDENYRRQVQVDYAGKNIRDVQQYIKVEK